MTLLDQTLLLYLVAGLGVAGAVYISPLGSQPLERLLLVSMALLFWPIFLPLLLSGKHKPSEMPSPTGCVTKDELASAITQVDAELEAALGSLDGWAEDVLAREKGRIQELRHAWTAQADRIREMDRLLALPENVEEHQTIDQGMNGSDRLRQSQEARRQNITRLRKVRQQAHDDLLGTLAWVRELVSMIHLAKFTGEPAARAEELVGQIAATVEGLSAVTWREEEMKTV
jgi:hypothetical protein